MRVPDIVLYHADCYDGMGAAWAIERYRQKIGAPAPKYVPVQYNKPLPPEDYRCNLLYIVDFSLPMSELEQLSQLARKIVVIDHHKSGEENLREVPRFDLNTLSMDHWLEGHDLLAHFNMSHSGATMTWRHFFGYKPEMPALLQYIEDRDIWKWSLPYSAEINAYISSREPSFENFDLLHETMKIMPSGPMSNAVTIGAALLRLQDKLVKSICKSARMTSFTDRILGSVPCVAVRSQVLQSEVGHELCRQFPEAKFAIIYSDIPGDAANIKWSLRSEDFDITQIVKHYGGGGHKSAGGMTTPTWRMV